MRLENFAKEIFQKFGNPSLNLRTQEIDIDPNNTAITYQSKIHFKD